MFIAKKTCIICERSNIISASKHWCKGGRKGQLYVLILLQYRFNGGPVSTAIIRSFLLQKKYNMTESRITKIIKLLKDGEPSKCESIKKRLKCDKKCFEKHGSIAYRRDPKAPRSIIFWINQRGIETVDHYLDLYRQNKRKIGTEIKEYFQIDTLIPMNPSVNMAETPF